MIQYRLYTDMTFSLLIFNDCSGYDYKNILPDYLGSVMVSMLALSVEDRGFKPWLGQTKDNEITICFSAN